jgi:hypothetical protein
MKETRKQQMINIISKNKNFEKNIQIPSGRRILEEKYTNSSKRRKS